MELHLPESQPFLTEDSVDQMLVLAERVRASNGGELDDSAIQAVAEATGAPVEYVRLLVKIKTEKEKGSFLATLKSQYLTLEPQTRRYVMAGFAAAMCAFFIASGNRVHNMGSNFAAEFLQIVSLFWLTLGLYNPCTAKDGKAAAILGALFAGGLVTGYEVFGFILGLGQDQAIQAIALIPSVGGGAIIGIVLQRITMRYRGQLGLKDPARERQDLLRQLQELQTKLKSGEQIVTFLSVDIVGSTKMKQLADPLAVEFTFNEYHQFIERIVKKHHGRIHSTAGDGVTCAFEVAQHAFSAARNVSAGLIKLNTFGNTIGAPIVLRQAIHTGKVITPESGDIKAVNFAQVIDVAAHLQKLAPEGSIVVSDESAETIPGWMTSGESLRVNAAGFSGTVWESKKSTFRVATGTPPPVPDKV